MLRPRDLVLFAAIALACSTAACAKRPSMVAASAPPPAAPAAPAPAPAPAPPPPVAAAPAPPAAPAPAPAPAERPAPKELAAVPELPDVYFDFDKSAIRRDAAKVLEASAKWLSDHKGHKLLIEGHCDERGTTEYNLALGDRRAKAAREFLVARGVAESRITTISYGEERPQCTQHAETCWKTNRRARFVVKAE
jgi:peptidoglycan-associated lipoprotein